MNKNKGLIEVFNKQLNTSQFNLNRCIWEYLLSKSIPLIGQLMIGSGVFLFLAGLVHFFLASETSWQTYTVISGGIVSVLVGIYLSKMDFAEKLIKTAERWFHLKRVMRKYRVDWKYCNTASGVALGLEDRLRQLADTVKRLESAGYTRKRLKVRMKFTELHSEAQVLGFIVSKEGEFFQGFGDVRVNTRIVLK
jgi:hypothetical protein